MRYRTGIYAEPGCKRHVTGDGHPESVQRFDAVMDALRAAALMDSLLPIEARRAARQELTLCHSTGYVDLVEREVGQGRAELSTGDTPLSPGSLEAALGSVGGVLSALDAVFNGIVDNAFCVARPPGHHASVQQGMGFCIFNNVAVAAKYGQARHGINRVLIVDWDVHHGNGTQDIFYRDGSVFFFSTHQAPWYPGTGSRSEIGEGPGAGATMNCPFPAATRGSAILRAFEEQLLPAMELFKPELVLISAGFDSRVDDPLGGFLLTDADFAELTRLAARVADTHAKGRLVSVLEGGYALAGLGLAAAAHVGTLQNG